MMNLTDTKRTHDKRVDSSFPKKVATKLKYRHETVSNKLMRRDVPLALRDPKTSPSAYVMVGHLNIERLN